MRQALLNRVRRVESRVPLTCRRCGRLTTADRSYTTLLLFEVDGQLMRYDRTPVAREDLHPCPGCGMPKERCGKILRGVEPTFL